MSDLFKRTEILLGEKAMDRLSQSRVAVFGIGGVGSYVVEALIRSGIGTLDLIDHDVVDATNINRQLIATAKTIGLSKVELAARRCEDINPDAVIHIHNVFFLPETADQFDFHNYDYVVDAIDTVTGKLALIEACNKAGTPIISSMGAGNKLDPTAFEVADIFSTSVCPLAKIMRKELRSRNIDRLKVVYSKEPPQPKAADAGTTIGSVAFVPSVAGLTIAGEVIKDLIS